MSVATFQRAFADALADAPRQLEAPASPDATEDVTGDLPRFDAQPAFAVHRNNVMVACIDALAANYPTVARLVGDDFFRATAAEFARAQLPERPSLFDYGAEFADFLAGFPPAASLPYLADVARVDRWWIESHVAADALVLTGTDLANRAPESVDRIRLRLHPAVRFGWFDQPIHSIWSRNRIPVDKSEGTDAGMDWCAEGVLLARPIDDVAAHRIGAAAWAFLIACASGATLAEATASAFECEPTADLAAMFAQLVGAGAFAYAEE